jgi:serine/threonine protein kinase
LFFLAKSKETEELCAIKYIHMFYQNASRAGNLFREAVVLSQMRHPFIIKFINCFRKEMGKVIIIFMEYDGGRDLKKYIQERGGKLPEDDARIVFAQIVEALTYCHLKGIIHGDLKFENIIVSNPDDLQIKVRSSKYFIPYSSLILAFVSNLNKN